MSDSVQLHRWQPTRLLCLWDSPGKNTGVGCHFLLQCMKVKSQSEVAQSCPTLSNPMDCRERHFWFVGCFFFFATWQSIWDLSSPCRNWNSTLQWRRGVLATGPQENPRGEMSPNSWLPSVKCSCRDGCRILETNRLLVTP